MYLNFRFILALSHTTSTLPASTLKFLSKIWPLLTILTAPTATQATTRVTWSLQQLPGSGPSCPFSRPTECTHHSRVEPFSELGRHWRALSKEMRSTLSLTPFVNCPPNAYLNFTLTQLTSPHSLHSRHPSPSSWSISTLHLKGLFGFAVLALWYALLTGIHPHSFFPISSSGLC